MPLTDSYCARNDVVREENEKANMMGQFEVKITNAKSVDICLFCIFVHNYYSIGYATYL